MYVAAESSRRGRQTPCGAGPAGGGEERKGDLGREGCAFEKERSSGNRTEMHLLEERCLA